MVSSFFEFMDVSYHSCDVFGSSLILSEKNGSIKYISDTMGGFSPDHFRKHIRFFPSDDFLFTTTDCGLGLRVWDREKEMEVFRYPQDSLGMHEYSSNKLIGAVSPSGAKFYDIRSRYHVSSCTLPLSLGLQWHKEELYCFSDSSVVKYSLRMDSLEEVVRDSFICDILLSKGGLYYLKLSDSKYFLVKEGVDYEIETVGGRGKALEDGTVCVFGNNEIKFYNGKESRLVDFDFVKNIEEVKFSKLNTYLFGDKKLYVKEGGGIRKMEGGIKV